MKRVRGHKYLWDRSGSLYFRRAVPPDVRHAFSGKTEYVKALGTRSVTEARHLVAVHLRSFDQTVAAARGTPDPTATAVELAKTTIRPTSEEIEAAVRLWRGERLAATTRTASLRSNVERGLSLWLSRWTP